MNNKTSQKQLESNGIAAPSTPETSCVGLLQGCIVTVDCLNDSDLFVVRIPNEGCPWGRTRQWEGDCRAGESDDIAQAGK